MEGEDHDKTKRYLALITGGHVEVIKLDGKKIDASSFNYRVFFEYERYQKRFRYDAEKLSRLIEDNEICILVVPDKDKEKAIEELGNDFPNIEVYSKSEIEELNPGLILSLLEDLSRGRKELRVTRQIIFRSKKTPRKKISQFVDERRRHREKRREKIIDNINEFRKRRPRLFK